MIAVGVVCVVLGFTAWKGVPGTIGSLLVADLGILTFAVCSKRWRLVVGSGIGLLAPLVLAGLYFFGPWSEVCNICIVCGKKKVIETFLGITLREEELDSEWSVWYGEVGMRPHAHQWVHLCSTVQGWGGPFVLVHADSFGFELEPLDLLKEVSQEVDRATFEHLAEDYYATRQDPATIPSFIHRCREILPAEDSETAGP